MFSFRLSTFLIGLLALSPLGYGLSTTPAMAHCDGVKHGPGHPHCDGGEPPPPPPTQPQVLVVRDGNGAIIGEVADWRNDGNTYTIVSVVYRGDPEDALFFEDHPLVVLTLKSSGPADPWWDTRNEKEMEVHFTTSNCSGTPYLLPDDFQAVPFNFPRLSVADVFDGQDIFVPADITETPTTIGAGSWYDEFGVCNPRAGSVVVITGERVHENFPRPYTVGF